MRGVVLLVFVWFSLSFISNEFCSPVRSDVSKLVANKGGYIFIKGYYILNKDGASEEFKVIKSTDDVFLKGETYHVTSYGPFGSECEMYEMQADGLENKYSGPENLRYLIAYKNRGEGERIVVPIFYDYGLVIDEAKDDVSDIYFEHASLKSFENYIYNTNSKEIEWLKIDN